MLCAWSRSSPRFPAMFTSATPSESNNLKPRRTRCSGFSIPANAFIESTNRASVERSAPCPSVSSIFSCFSASRASPVPPAASAARRPKRCKPIFRVSILTPLCTAANWNSCNAEFEMPNLSDIFPIASAAAREPSINLFMPPNAAIWARPNASKPSLTRIEPMPLNAPCMLRAMRLPAVFARPSAFFRSRSRSPIFARRFSSSVPTSSAIYGRSLFALCLFALRNQTLNHRNIGIMLCLPSLCLFTLQCPGRLRRIYPVLEVRQTLRASQWLGPVNSCP